MHRRSLPEADNNREDDDKGIGGSIIHYVLLLQSAGIKLYACLCIYGIFV